MTGLFQASTQGKRGLGRLDPRTRVLAAPAFALSVLSLSDPSLLCLALLLAGGLMLASGLPMGRTLKRMLLMDGFVVGMLLLLPFTMPGTPFATVLGFPLSWEGLERAIEIGLKANAVVLALMALVGGMEPTVVGHALARLHLPENLVHLLLFTVRYVDVIQAEYARMRAAMTCRGFQPGNNRHTYRTFGYLIGMLLVRSLERSERILEAMKCRGFSGRLVLLDNPRFTGLDGVFCLTLALPLIALPALEALHVRLF